MIAFALLAILATSPPGPQQCFELRELRRCGDFELEAGALDARSRKAEGGVLSEARGVVATSSNIYVLHFNKVVVFDRAGLARQVILGGWGKGPGEFIISFSLCSECDRQLNPHGNRFPFMLCGRKLHDLGNT